MDEFNNYQDFPFSVEFYDHLPFNASLADIDFFLEYAAAADGPVLELGCGTGRVLIPMARRGSEITGLDISSLMLDATRAKLEREPEEVRDRVRLIEESMHRFDLDKQFGLIFSAVRSFQVLISVDDQLACLACVSRHLASNGRLILNVFDPHLPFLIGKSRKEEWARDEPFTMPDGRVVEQRLRNPKVNQTRQVIDCEMIYYVTHPDGRQERLVQSFPLRYFFRFEMEHLLARAGFELEDVFGDYDRGPFGATRPGEMIFVARKASTA